MKFTEFQLLTEARIKKAKAEFIDGPKKNSPRFTFKVLDVYFTISLSPIKQQAYKQLPGNIHPVTVEAYISSDYKSDSKLSTPILDFVRKNIDFKEIKKQLDDLDITISRGHKYYDQNITSLTDVRKDEEQRYKAQVKADPQNQGRLSANYAYNDNHPVLTKKAERIVKAAVTTLFKEHGDKLLGDQQVEESSKKAATHASKKVELKDDDIFDKHNVKEGVPVKIRTRLEGVQTGVVTDGFEIDDDGDLIISWKSDKDGDGYWAYTSQIVELNSKSYSTYKDKIEQMFKK